jgi:hypothetical protein
MLAPDSFRAMRRSTTGARTRPTSAHVEVRQAMHQIVEVPPRMGVESGGGLVEEQQLGPANDADRDVQPSPLPTGQ